MKLKFVGRVSIGEIDGIPGLWEHGKIYDVDEKLAEKLLQTGQFEVVEKQPVKTSQSQ